MSTAKKSSAPKKKAVASSHPPFADMIKECITAHPAEARAGVSRPTIKKFLETRYGLDISASTVTNINRAIAHGAEKGVFSLPKGPSGKVKLAPKGRSDPGKENVPAPKSNAAKKPKVTGAKSRPSSRPMKKVNVPSRSKKTSAKRTSGTKKSAATVKKVSKAPAKPAKKASATTKKAIKTSTRPTASSKKTPAKKTSGKRAPAKKSITGTTKTAAAKPKAPAKKAGTTSAKRKAAPKKA